MGHEDRIFWTAVAAGLPGAMVSLGLLWTGDHSDKVQWTLTALVVVLWWGFAFSVRERVVMPLQTLANLLEALREGDYSIRAREPRTEDALGDVYLEVNQLGEMLRSQRFDVIDAETLLENMIEEIEVAVFTFDGQGVLQLVNRAGERMMAQDASQLLGRSAQELSLDDCLEGASEHTFERTFPGQTGRWQCRHSSFREKGQAHHLLVLSDLSRALRDEERQAWQRLIRVLGHELNNSLAPIKSTASTLESLLRRDDPHEGWRDDAQSALSMIAKRCGSLTRFVSAYSRLARLPAPTLRPMAIAPLVRRVVSFETRMAVSIDGGPDLEIAADADQLEQLLINLVKNAVEAAQELDDGDGSVTVDWQTRREMLEIRVADTGPGLSNTQNLFVPFFTTKPGGTGIGLVLCRQIAEAHGGSLKLDNRADVRGCVACLRLPIRPLL